MSQHRTSVGLEELAAAMEARERAQFLEELPGAHAPEEGPQTGAWLVAMGLAVLGVLCSAAVALWIIGWG